MHIWKSFKLAGISNKLDGSENDLILAKLWKEEDFRNYIQEIFTKVPETIAGNDDLDLYVLEHREYYNDANTFDIENENVAKRNTNIA